MIQKCKLKEPFDFAVFDGTNINDLEKLGFKVLRKYEKDNSVLVTPGNYPYGFTEIINVGMVAIHISGYSLPLYNSLEEFKRVYDIINE